MLNTFYAEVLICPAAKNPQSGLVERKRLTGSDNGSLWLPNTNINYTVERTPPPRHIELGTVSSPTSSRSA